MLSTEEGEDTILVAICTGIRYVNLYATKGTSAEVTIDPLVDMVGRYVAPKELLSDMGPQFVNQVITNLTEAIGIEHTTTMAYSKQENSINERVNKEVMRHLRALVYEIIVHSKWKKYLPLVARIINSAYHSSLGASPAELLYGRAVNLDQGIFLPETERCFSSGKKLSKGVAEMLQVQKKLLAQATVRQQERATQHMINKSGKGPITEFPVNSFVLVEYPDTRMGRMPPTKLHPIKKGPFRVVKFVGAKYDLINLNNNQTEKGIHVTRLLPFDYDELRTIPSMKAMSNVKVL